MNKLIIGFESVEAKPSFHNRVLSFAVDSKIYHSELIFEGHTPERFSAWNDFGTGFRPSTDIGDKNHWYFFDLGTAYYNAALRFAESQKGKPYDLKAAYNTAFSRKPSNLSNAWYCSEVCHAALRFAGVPLLDIPSSSVLPPDLFTMIKSLNYPQITR